MKHYDYWLFDWDGCLARTLEVWLAAYQQGLREFGATPPEREIAHHFGDWRGAEKLGVAPLDNDACLARIAELGKEKNRTADLYPGAANLLKQLREDGTKLALLSSSPGTIVRAALAHNGVDGAFGVVLTAEDVTNHKPDPEIIEKALEILGGTAEQAVMVGDSRKDLGAAANAGCDSILVFPSAHEMFYDLDELKSYNPTHVVDGFPALLKLVREAA